ncbi:MAG: amino acid adenylation domain-containing protein, partial [Clostridium sp.]|nr:amino acid adenylation domain-containing protein [Clostridium sp.]
LFKEESIKRFAKSYVKILEEITSNVDVKIKDIEIISDEDKKLIINEFNNTEKSFSNKTIDEEFREIAKLYKDREALAFKDRKITYKELENMSDSLSYELIKQGIKKGDRVSIMTERSMEMIIAVLAVLKCGAIYVPMDIEYPDSRLNYMLEDSGCTMVLTNCERVNSLKYEGKVIDLNDKTLYENRDVKLNNEPRSNDDAAYIIYTSGSTGKPKGVLLRHRGVLNLKETYKERCNINCEDRMVLFASLSFDASVSDIIMALLNGAALYVLDKDTINDYKKITNYLNDNKITTAMFPPAYIKGLDESKIKTLKTILTGGSASTYEIVEKWRKNRKYINAYGPTEVTVDGTLWIADENKHDRIPIGKPVNNNKIFILDKDLNMQPIGVWGEILVSGPGVALGYLNREDLNNEKFIECPYSKYKMYKTGDVGRYLPDGNVELLGRIDDQVKIRGFRIEIGEVENKILSCDSVKEGTVIVKEDENNEKYLCAFIVYNDEGSEKKLKKYLRKTLPKYMIPSYFVTLDKIPLTVNGKIDKKALPMPNFSEKLKKYIAPETDTEIKLQEMWSQILGVKKIGIEDDFFDLGGQSLKAILLKTKINEVFFKEVTIQDIFNSSCIRKLAKLIDNLNEKSSYKIEKVSKQDYYECSSAEKRLYALCEMDKESTVYNIPIIFKIEGQFKREKFENIFEKLTRRHEALRTYFDVIDGQVVQKISEDCKVHLNVTKENISIKEKVEKFMKPFNLNKAPLYRGEIFENEEGTYLLIDVHHIIADGLSVNILYKEFKKLYEGESLEDLNLSYKDFSAFNQKLLNSDEINKEKQYWLNEFEDEVPVLNLPLDYERPLIQNFEGNSMTFCIDKALRNKIEKISRETKTTIHMVFLSALNILLSKCSDSEDIIIGTPNLGRNLDELQSMVGMFVNVLAIRNNPEGNKSFIEFLKEVKEKSLKAYENSNYEFEKLTDELKLQRISGRNPLFDVVINMDDTIDEVDIELKDVTLKNYRIESTISKFDLTFNIVNRKDGFDLIIEYCTKLFKEETIRRFAGYFINILQEVVKTPSIKIKDIDYISNDEKHILLEKFNDTKKNFEFDKTINDLFLDVVNRIPDNKALVFRNEELTFRELNEKVDSLAYVLRQKGVKRGSFVGIITERSTEMIISVLAVLKAGGAYVPMDLAYPDSRINYMLEDCECKMILTNNKERLKSLNFEGTVIDVEDKNIYKQKHKLENINDANDLAYVIYTSGSTGLPKGVLIKHIGISNLKTNFKEQYDFNENDRFVQFASFTFDISVWEIFMSLLNGATLYVLDRETIDDYDKYINYLNDNRITATLMTPAYFSNVDSKKIKTLKKVFTGGSEASCEMVKEWSKERDYTNLYGPTETTITCTMWRAEKEFDCNIVPIGKPAYNTKHYVFDKYNKLKPLGAPGELCIASVGLAKGYLNREELNKERFIENPYVKGETIYKSGDLVRLLPDGNVQYLGRIDNQVKIRGFRIELGEIENKILSNQYVKEAVVRVYEGNNKEKYICAYVCSEKSIEELDLKGFLKQLLPEYMIPNIFVELEKIPLTINGKVNNKALPKPDFNKNLKGYKPPETDTEIKLQEIWSQILGVEKIGIEDNFFDLGGQSLKAIILKTKINEVFLKEVTIQDIFSN